MKLFIICVLIAIVSSQSCISQLGTTVDWWIIFKVPKSTSLNYTGMEYYYCDSDNNCQSLDQQADQLDQITSPLQRTIQQIDFNSETTMSIMWSDQPFNKNTVSDRAHSKGILSASLDGNAFLITHSTPSFPMLDAEYNNIVLGMPSSAYTNGQHYMCTSITTETANRMALQYIIAEIVVNRANAPTQFQSSYPPLFELKNNRRSKKYTTESNQPVASAMQDTITISTRNNLILQMFSKNELNLVDFYSTIVAPGIQQNLVVETWGNGVGGLQSPQCTANPTSISNLMMQFGTYQFSYTKDHSKYAISSSPSYVCVSDMNRQLTQQKRGGTSLCFQNVNLWNIVNTQFINRQSC